MDYLEYERYRLKYNAMQERFASVLLEKERLFTNTLPSGIRYDKDKVQHSVDDNPLEEYVIQMDEKQIDDTLDQMRKTIKDWEMLLEVKERELRKSLSIPDRIYTCRYLDGDGIGKISSSLCYSKSQVYRILRKIEKRCDKMRQNATNYVL